MMSSQNLWQFKKGDKIAQLLLVPYSSINSSNDIWTGGFDSTDQKQSLQKSIVSEYAQFSSVQSLSCVQLFATP